MICFGAVPRPNFQLLQAVGTVRESIVEIMSAALFVNGINAGKLIPETAQYRFVVRVGRLLASVGRFGLLLRLVQGIDRRIGRRRIGFLSVSSLFPGFQPGDDRVPFIEVAA